MANRRLILAGELDAMCGFAPKFQTEGTRDLVGNCSRSSQSFDMEHIEENDETRSEKPWTRQLTPTRASARSPAPTDTGTATGGRTSSTSGVLHQHSPAVRSDGRGVRLRQGVQEPRPRRRDQGPARPDDRLAGLVAGRLRPLRRPVHPHGLAQRRHLPHRRRPRRRRRRPAALRAAQQLAGQRQPRQGAPPAVADQAEVRPQDLLGRPL